MARFKYRKRVIRAELAIKVNFLKTSDDKNKTTTLIFQAYHQLGFFFFSSKFQRVNESVYFLFFGFFFSLLGESSSSEFPFVFVAWGCIVFRAPRGVRIFDIKLDDVKIELLY